MGEVSLTKNVVLHLVAALTVVLGPPREISPPNVVIKDEANDRPRDKVYRARIRDCCHTAEDDWEAFQMSAQGN